MKRFSLIAYSFSHFSVDFCCFWILFGAFSKTHITEGEIALGFMAYNLIAFGLQVIFGAFCDEHRNFPAGAVGAVLVLTAVLTAGFAPTAALVITALGNALFHVGGGIDSLVHSGGKLARGGIFVSAGALGVVLGTFLGSNGLRVIIPIALAASSALLSLFAHRKAPVTGDCEICGTANKKPGIWWLLALTLFAVFIRSFGGNAMPSGWKIGDFALFAAAFAAFAGKFSGGILADKFGAKNLAAASLLLSLPIIVLGADSMPLSLLGIVLFNMQMPVTLGICAEALPKNPGLAFGLTTLALVLGAVPSFFFVISGKIWLFIPAVLLSVASLWFAADNKKSEVLL